MTRFSYNKKYTDRFNVACQWYPNVILMIIDQRTGVEVPVILGYPEIDNKIRVLESRDSLADYYDKVLDYKIDYLEYTLNIKLR